MTILTNYQSWGIVPVKGVRQASDGRRTGGGAWSWADIAGTSLYSLSRYRLLASQPGWATLQFKSEERDTGAGGKE